MQDFDGDVVKLKHLIDREKYLLGPISISSEAITLKDVSELRRAAYVHKLNAMGVKSLVSLEGCPRNVDILWCLGTSIKDLNGGPRKACVIDCGNNEKFNSLEGCPEEVQELRCNKTSICTLKGGPKKVHELILDGNPQLVLTKVWVDIHYCESYEQYGKINKDSGLLGLLRVNRLNRILCESNSPLSIVKKYIPLITMSSIMKCRQELIDAGFRSNAKF